MSIAVPRIALIHAVYAAMAPTEAAFATEWPEARLVNLIDDALPADLEADGGMTVTMVQRIGRLAQHAISAGAQGVLFTCSAFGEAIAKAAGATQVPVLKPNEAMFSAALGAGSRIGLLGTFAPAMHSMEEEFQAMALARRLRPSLRAHCIPAAHAAARSGDVALHNWLVAEGARQMTDCDVVMLAHFSTSTAMTDVQLVLDCRVLSAPRAAVIAMRSLV